MSRKYIKESQCKQIDSTHIEVDGIIYTLCDHTKPSCTCDRSHESVGMTREDFEALTMDEKIEKITNSDTFKDIMNRVEVEFAKINKN